MELARDVWSVPVVQETEIDGLLFRPSNPDTIREAAIGYLDGFLSNLRGRPFWKDHRPFLQTYGLGERAAIWTYDGDLFSLDPVDLAKSFVREGVGAHKQALEYQAAIANTPATESATVDLASRQKHFDGHGVHLYPSVCIGTMPNLSFSQRLGRLERHGLGYTTINVRVGGFHVIATYSGFVGILGVRKSEAMSLLNALCLSLCLKGLHLDPIRPAEVGSFNKGDDEQNPTYFAGWEMPGFKRMESASQSGLPFYSQAIDEKTFEMALTAAVEIHRRNAFEDHYLFLQALAHLNDEEHTQALSMAWMVIDRQVQRVWKATLNSKGLAERRKDKMLNTAVYTTDTIIETLEFAGLLQEALYARTTASKGSRNDVIHGRRNAQPDEAKAAIWLAADWLTHVGYPIAMDGVRS